MRQFKQYKKDTIGNGHEDSSHILHNSDGESDPLVSREVHNLR